MSAGPPANGQRRSGLTAKEVVLLHAANLAVSGSGLVYAVLRYLVRSRDPWALVNHPWQPAAQHAHVVLAPLLVFALGVLWRPHALASWARPASPRRWSGAALGLAAGPMVISGVLIQAVVAPGWRSLWVGVHLASSGLWLVSFVTHQLAKGSDRGGEAPTFGTPAG